ncbi:MAG: ATP-binding cassette domain-containing protein, partial [Deltaproteobacteria bacterium]
MSLISTDHVSIRIGAQQILSDVSFAIEPLEIITIVGPNGSGKTTLLRTILGIIQPTTGKVTRQPGLRVGYVPQRLAIDQSMPLSVARFMS